MFDSTLDDFMSHLGVWTDINDLTTQQKETAITLAERRIQRGDGTPNEPGLRVREMETVFSETISGSGTIAVPADFLDLKSAYVDSNPKQVLERKNPEFIRSKYPTSATGKPKFIAREGSNFIFGPTPDSQYLIKGIYYAKLPSLIDDSTVNGVFSAYSDIYLKGTVLEIEKLIGRERRTQTWEPDFKRQILAANKQAEQEEYSGSSLRVTAS